MVVVCMAALLLALPAQAAQSQRTQKTAAERSSPAVSAWLDSIWTEVLRILKLDSPARQDGSRQGGAAGLQNIQHELGSCIDPDGSCSSS